MGIKAKLHHKNAAFEWLKADSNRTQNQACELLGKALLPGCEGIKVLLKKRNLSKFCVKKNSGQDGKGRPQLLDDETCQFITKMLEMGSSKHKCQLFVQIATFMRTMVLLKEGIVTRWRSHTREETFTSTRYTNIKCVTAIA